MEKRRIEPKVVLEKRYRKVLDTDVSAFQRRIHSSHMGMKEGFSLDILLQAVKLGLNDAVWNCLSYMEKDKSTGVWFYENTAACEDLQKQLNKIFESKRSIDPSKLMMMLAFAYACEKTDKNSFSIEGALNISKALKPGVIHSHYEMYRPFLMRDNGLDFLLPSFWDSSDKYSADPAPIHFSIMYGKLLGYNWDYPSIFSKMPHLPYVLLSNTLLEVKTELSDVTNGNIKKFVRDYINHPMAHRPDVDWVRVKEDMIFIDEGDHNRLPNDWLISILIDKNSEIALDSV